MIPFINILEKQSYNEKNRLKVALGLGETKGVWRKLWGCSNIYTFGVVMLHNYICLNFMSIKNVLYWSYTSMNLAL